MYTTSFTLTATPNVLKSLLVVVALVLATAACDGPVGPQGDRGPQGTAGEDGSQGPEGPQGPAGDDGADGQNGQDGQDGQDGQQGPQGPAGEDGNANVTLYIFEGHDFFNDSHVTFRELSDIENPLDYTWLVYLVRRPGTQFRQYLIPGRGSCCDGEYAVETLTFPENPNNNTFQFEIGLVAGGGEEFDEIHIYQIGVSNVEDCSGGSCLRASPESLLPSDLDVSDYNAVMDYYGLTEADAVRM